MTKEERRQRAEKARQEREKDADLAALRLVRDHPDSTPAERLRAVEILLKLEGEHYG